MSSRFIVVKTLAFQTNRAARNKLAKSYLMFAIRESIPQLKDVSFQIKIDENKSPYVEFNTKELNKSTGLDLEQYPKVPLYFNVFGNRLVLFVPSFFAKNHRAGNFQV